jgi:putative iron-only hydrogenase system regulator
MEKRIALLGIMIEDIESSGKVNDLLHEYSDRIVGRMGIPYRDRGLSIISVVIDASGDDISALAGKLGRIKGISVKTMQATVN